MNFVLDASVALAWAFEDEGGEYAVAVLESLRKEEAVVASHWGLEVANGLLTAQRRGRIDASGVGDFVPRLLALPIVTDPAARERPFRETSRLAHAYHLTSYDAAYLEVATRLAVPVATLDRALGAAAEKEGVGRFEPQRL